jgi:integrase
MRLSKRTVAALGQVDRPTLIYDEDLKGFGIRLTPPSTRHASGARSWIVEYRSGAGGRRAAKRRVTLGSTETLTPEQARGMATELLAMVRLGDGDCRISLEKRMGADRPTSGLLCQLCMLYSEESDPIRKAGTVKLYQGYWKNHILPVLGNMGVTHVTRADIVRLHRVIGLNNRTTANRVLGLLSHFFKWAAKASYVPSGFNPCLFIDKFKENSKERFLSHEELGRLGDALLKAETEGIAWARDAAGPLSKHAPKRMEHRRTRIDADVADAVRLLLFTGARLREVLNLRWSQYDRQRGLLLLSDSKTGRKTIVLGQHAVDTLERIWERAISASGSQNFPENSHSTYAFPAQQGKSPRADLKRPWAMLVREAQLPGLRIHDLRHSFASVGVAVQLGLPVIGGLLGHSTPQTTERYAHLAAAPLRSAANLISSDIEAALSRGCRSAPMRSAPTTRLSSSCLVRETIVVEARSLQAANDETS